MCGIAGFLTVEGLPAEAEAIAHQMADAIRHRGPDGSGVWVDSEAGIALAHRRLAIVDLSPAGHQPMVSASGRCVIVFNGEIYNHHELRRTLEAEGCRIAWRGHSDTEVLLECVAAWGLERALQAAVGMFAFAVWDRQARTLALARDRLGEKPLYWGTSGRTLLFGSELSALAAHPSFDGTIDRGALALMMRFNGVPAPHSIFAGIGKLEPGHYVIVDPRQRAPAKPVRYWDLAAIARAGETDPFTGSAEDAVDEVERLLKAAIAGQMVADVPLGAFLSGGLDSSAVVALMQELSPTPVKTFTIGFGESGFDEAQHAERIARHLGTEHHELRIDPSEALAVIPELPRIYDEPFADSSQIPTFLVARMARGHVTVALSGDAGDEVFSGYRRYDYADRIWSRIAHLPRPLRAGAARLIQGVAPGTLDRLAGGRALAGDRLHKAARVLGMDDVDAAYDALVSHWQDAEALVSGAPPMLARPVDTRAGSDPVRRMMYRDSVGYLPDDILVKVDRAAMAVSLECRVPFLDHRLLAFAWRLPLTILRRNGQSKWPLRAILARRMPSALTERPKAGFAIPLSAWLKGPLRPWAEAMLDPARLRRGGYLDPTPVTAAWHDLLAGRRASQEAIWNVLMFEAWLESWTDRTRRTRPTPPHTGIAERTAKP